VTIRLLDPPLHEFLPHTDEEIAEVAEAMNAEPRKLKERAAELAEFNPMLGFRGCRLAIAYPEIAEMQARAIFEAAAEAGKRTGAPVVPEVMVPLIATRRSSTWSRRASTRWRRRSRGDRREGRLSGRHHDRAAARLLKAGEIAETAEFFSFGTNDLTQTTFGISRDDAASFLGPYQPRGFSRRSVRVARPRRRRRTDPHRDRRGPQGAQRLKLGICGEHGGDPHRSRSATSRARLRVLLAVPRADRAAGRGAGRARQGGGQYRLSCIAVARACLECTNKIF
jgi:pyruvate,orthophosphate dikinase